MITPILKNDKLFTQKTMGEWISNGLVQAPSVGESEWHAVHQKTKKISLDFPKVFASTVSEDDKIALLQAGHDALYLLSGNVTLDAQRRYLSIALPFLEDYLDRHESDSPMPASLLTPSACQFLRLSLNILYSTAFLSSFNPKFGDRLTSFVAPRLDALRNAPAISPDVADLLALEDELFQEA